MKIIIAGLGKIGWAVAELLASQRHDVTIIDVAEARVANAANALDVIAIEGSAASLETLRTAGAAEADILIATTHSDELNLVSCMVGQRLGCQHTVARVRETEYLRQADFLRESFGLSLLINPELAAAAEIARILRFPTATRMETFSHGRVELAEYRLPENSSLAGRPLRETGVFTQSGVLVCAVERDDQVSIPKGDYVPQPGDLLSLAAEPERLRAFFKALGVYKRAVRNVLIMGGSRIAVYLCRKLEQSGIHCRLLERDPIRAQELCELLPHAEIINSDGSKREVLLEQGMHNADGFVALTGSDEENLILSLYVHTCGVTKVITKVNEEHLIHIMEDSGLDCFINPKHLVVQQITQYVRALENSLGSSVETLYRIVGGRVEALEFVVGPASRCLDTPLRDLPLRDDVLVVAVTSKNQVVIPRGDTMLRAGDRAVIITTQSGIGDLDDVLTEN